ncbi:hypothetical protein LCGC14_1830720, partial [marine sediment metagenome]
VRHPRSKEEARHALDWAEAFVAGCPAMTLGEGERASLVLNKQGDTGPGNFADREGTRALSHSTSKEGPQPDRVGSALPKPLALPSAGGGGADLGASPAGAADEGITK